MTTNSRLETARVGALLLKAVMQENLDDISQLRELAEEPHRAYLAALIIACRELGRCECQERHAQFIEQLVFAFALEETGSVSP